MHTPGHYESLAKLELTADQVSTIEEKTGIKVSDLEVLSVVLTGEAARTRTPSAEAGLVMVACW